MKGRETGLIPFAGYEQLLGRRFPEAIDTFLAAKTSGGLTITLASAISESYHRLAFQTLADQVRKSVRAVKGNQWMFRTGHPADIPLRIREELLTPDPATGCMPSLRERTAVRMDFTHSAWSDIFFLGMDFPEGAKVINASVDLAVRGQHSEPQPPIDCNLRVIDEPVLRLVSIDLNSKADIREVNEVFDFGRDYLGLLQSCCDCIRFDSAGNGRLRREDFGSVFSPDRSGAWAGNRESCERHPQRIAFGCQHEPARLPDFGLHESNRTGVAVVRALTESDRRTVAARAILGEWLGGSGGGWQDSGGVWPGIKLIEGARPVKAILNSASAPGD